MTIKQNLKITKEYVMLALIFLASMNFMAKFFCFVFLAFLVLIFFRKKIYLSKTVYAYLLLCSWMSAYNFVSEGVMSAIRCLASCTFFVVGYNLIDVNKNIENKINWKQIEDKLYKLLFALAGGSFLHYFLNYLLNWGNNIGRNTLDIWSNSTMAATGQAALACIMCGLSIAFIVAPPKPIYRYLSIIILGIIFIYNLTLAGRTLLVMMIVLFLVAVLYRLRTQKNKTKRHNFIMGVVLCIIILAILYFLNVGGIRDYIITSSLFERLQFISEGRLGNDTSRIGRKIGHLGMFFEYPLGGLHKVEIYGYAHDIFLDGYDEYGIVVLLLLMYLVFEGVMELYKFCKYSLCNNECKIAIICVYCAIFMEFMIEPILAGMPWLFSCYSLLNACVKSINTGRRK